MVFGWKSLTSKNADRWCSQNPCAKNNQHCDLLAPLFSCSVLMSWGTDSPSISLHTALKSSAGDRDRRVDSSISPPWNCFQPLTQVIQDRGGDQLGPFWWRRCELPLKTFLCRSRSEAWLPSRTAELEADRRGWSCVAAGTGTAAGWLLVGLLGPL